MTVLGAIALQGMRNAQDAPRLPLAPGVIVVIATERTSWRNSGRPTVLVRRDDSDDHAWWVADLTIAPSYASGDRRVELTDWRGSGLHGPGFLWGGLLKRVSVDDVTGRLGRITPVDAVQICDQHHRDLTPTQAAVFLAVCS